MNEEFVQIQMLHQGAHAATDDPEDTITIAFTQAEFTTVSLGTHLALIGFPCLEPVLDRLTAKIVQLVEAQRPDWVDAPFWGTHGED